MSTIKAPPPDNDDGTGQLPADVSPLSGVKKSILQLSSMCLIDVRNMMLPSDCNVLHVATSFRPADHNYRFKATMKLSNHERFTIMSPTLKHAECHSGYLQCREFDKCKLFMYDDDVMHMTMKRYDTEELYEFVATIVGTSITWTAN